MDEHPLRGLIVIAVLIMISALITAAETTLKNINESNLKKRIDEGEIKYKKVMHISDSRARYSNAADLLIITSNLLIGITFSFSQYDFIINFIKSYVTKSENSICNLIIMIFIITVLIYFMLLFGIFLPKRLSKKNADNNAYRFSGIIYLIVTIITPVLWLIEKNAAVFLRMFCVKPEDFEDNVTEEEIISILNEGQEQGLLEAEEAEMITNIFDFDDKNVRDIMTHRIKMVSIPDTFTVEEALRFMISENYSRFPVYQNDIDNIIGVLHLKDVVSCFMNPKKKKDSIVTIASEPYFVPDTQSIGLLLHDMQLKKVHLAIVIDEYGQTDGLVTLEDILEEIVGDIQDEHDHEDIQIFDQGDESFLIMGETSLEDIIDQIPIPMEEAVLADYETLNGLLISKLDRIPSDGEKVCVSYAGYSFEIMDIQNKMIHLVRVCKLAEIDEEKEEQTEHEDA